MTSISNARQIEYTTQTTTLGGVDISKQLAGNGNSLNRTPERKTVTLNEFKNEIDKIAKKYNLSSDELLQIYQNVFKKSNIKNLERLDDSAKARVLRQIKSSISDCAIQNKTITKENLTNFLTNKKEEIKKFRAAQDGLLKVLNIDNKYKSINEVPDEVLKPAIEKFIVNNLKQTKAENLTKENIIQQLNKFNELVAGTNENDLTRFYELSKEVMAKSGLINEAITELVKNINSAPIMKELLDKVTDEQFSSLGIDKDKLTKAMLDITEPGNADFVKNALVQLNKIAEENIIKYKSYESQIKKYQQEHPKENITDETVKNILGENSEEYFKIRNKIQNTADIQSSSIITASANGVNISEEMAHMHKIYQDTDFESNIYDSIETYIKNHENELKDSGISIDELRKNINSYSDNRFFQTVSPEEAKKAESTFCANQNSNSTPPENIILAQNKLKNIQQSLYQNQEDNQFTVETKEFKPENGEILDNNEVSETVVKMKLATSSFQLLSPDEIMYAVNNKLGEMHEIMKGVGKKVSQASQQTAKMFVEFVDKIGDSCLKSYYASLSSGAARLIAPKVNEKSRKNINVDYNTKKYIENLEKQENKEHVGI